MITGTKVFNHPGQSKNYSAYFMQRIEACCTKQQAPVYYAPRKYYKIINAVSQYGADL